MNKNLLLSSFFILVSVGLQAQIDSSCKTSDNDYAECEQKKEAQYLAGCQQIAVRKGKVLSIKLLSKATLNFENTILDTIELSYDSVTTYIFKKHYKENTVVVIERINVNGVKMVVLNLATGKKVETNWLPVFSPDKKRFAVVSGTEFNTYSPEMLEIFVSKNGNYTREFEFKPEGALTYLGACKWQGGERIAISRINYGKTNASGKPLKSDITIAMFDNKWTVMGK